MVRGQLGLELEWPPVGNLSKALGGHEVPLESLLYRPASRLCAALFARHLLAPVPTVTSSWKLTFQAHALEELQGHKDTGKSQNASARAQVSQPLCLKRLDAAISRSS